MTFAGKKSKNSDPLPPPPTTSPYYEFSFLNKSASMFDEKTPLLFQGKRQIQILHTNKLIWSLFPKLERVETNTRSSPIIGQQLELPAPDIWEFLI